MSDRNPMLQGLMNPVPNLGVIPGKAQVDYDLVEARKANNDDPRRKMFCYPGGGDNVNYDVMPGDLSFGQKNVRDQTGMDGEPNELGITSVAGLCWDDYCSQRDMEDNFYFQGVVTSEQRLEHYMDAGTADPNHGYSMGRAGTFSIHNNGPKTFYPGDWIAWQFPECPITPGNKDDIAHGGDLDHPGINLWARGGAPPTQFRPIVVPFDPTDLSIDLAGAFSSIITPKNLRGVSDVDFVDSLPNVNGYKGEKPWTCLQDEALSYKFGIMGVAMTVIESLIQQGKLQLGGGAAVPEREAALQIVDLSEDIGMWSSDSDKQGPMLQALADVFMTKIGSEHTLQDAAKTRFQNGHGNAYDSAVGVPSDAAKKYARLRVHLMETLTNGIAGSAFSRREKVIGRAMNAAAPGDTLHTVMGHTTL